MRTIVIGGGAIGLSVAESLSSRGGEVTLFERDRCGAAASAGNAGWITPSLAIPVPGPGVIGDSLRWLVNPSGPLWIRPTLSPAMLSWIGRFITKCARPAYRRGLASLQQAAALAGPSFDRLVARGVDFELHDDPLLYPAFDQLELEHLWHVVEELRNAGACQPIERLSADELIGLEPALDEGAVGGVIARGERRVRPELLTAGLRRALVSRGAEVLEHSPVTGLVRDRSRWVVESSTTSRRGEVLVIASGVESARLLARLGVHVPVVAAKGYSRTYPRDPTGPHRPLYLEGPKVAISVFDGGVRVSGTLELGARSLGLSSRRLTAVTTAAQRALPNWQMPARPRDWAGMRSLSPDGLPYIGAVPGLESAFLATGHATLGITLAPITGELLAKLVQERASCELLAAFDPARAVSRRGRPSSEPARLTVRASGRKDKLKAITGGPQ